MTSAWAASHAATAATPASALAACSAALIARQARHFGPALSLVNTPR